MESKKFRLILLASFLAVIVLRTLEIVLFTDYESGFYYPSAYPLVTWMSVIIAAIVLGMSGWSWQHRVKTTEVPVPNIFLGGAAIMLGVGLLAEPFFGIVLPETVPEFIKYATIIGTILSGLVFLYIGFSNFFGKIPQYITIVVPVVAWVFKVLQTFLCYTNMASISENSFEIISLCAVIMFFLYHARVLLRISTRKNQRPSRFFTVAALLLTGACSLPPIIATLFFGYTRMFYSADSTITNLLLLMYIIAFLLSKKVPIKKEITFDFATDMNEKEQNIN